MTQHQHEVKNTIEAIAEEQVLFLQNRYRMEPAEIIRLYTGERHSDATYGDAIRSIMAFNAKNAQQHGFVA